MSRRRKRRKRIESRSEYILKRLLIIFGCILAVGVILVATVKIITIVGRNRLTENANTEGPTLEGDEDSIVKSGDVNAEEWQDGWISYNGKVYEYNEDIRTFLVLGIDEGNTKGFEADEKVKELTGGGQSDGIFLIILNPMDESIKIFAINRDTKVDILMVGMGEGGTDVTGKFAISTQHGFGGGGKYSCELSRDAVSRLIYDMPIHGYVSIQYSDIPAINDAVGGVTLTLPEDDDDLTVRNKNWKAGATITLKGQEAHDFVRYRDIYGGSESQRRRLGRHKLYLKSFIKQMKEKTKEDITLPMKIYNSIKDDVVTDLSVDTISYLVSEYADYSFDENDIYTMEGETKLGEDGFAYFYPDDEALKALVIKLFYKEVDR